MINKSWDKIWEKVFSTKEWGKYPTEELVRFVARNYYSVPDRGKVKILDLGCGTGAATWFMAREGFSVTGIDGSKTAIKIAEKRFTLEGLKGDFAVGDIIDLDYGNGTFDCVTDIGAIQHNSYKNIKKIISEVYRVLKPGGKFFGMMIAADESQDRSRVTHYFRHGELKRLFSAFQNLNIGYVVRTKDRHNKIIKYWLVQAIKNSS